MGGRKVGMTLMWDVGWRRDDVYASLWIDVSELISETREYFEGLS